jgi:hypothetical protein
MIIWKGFEGKNKMLVNESELSPLVRARDDLDTAIKALKDREAILYKRREVLQMAIDALRSGDDEIQELLNKGRKVNKTIKPFVDETALKDFCTLAVTSYGPMGIKELCRMMEADGLPFTVGAVRRVLRGGNFQVVGKSVNSKYVLTPANVSG